MENTAVIYARFSCSKQREASIEDQLRICNEYAEREGLTVVGTYCDFAVSGRTDERPEFQRMIMNAGESSVVLVYMMDRFSRDQYDAPIYKKRLMKKGVRVVSAMERVDQTPDGVIMEKLLEGLAARESMVTSQRVRRGMEGNARKCLYNGYPLMGYRVDPETRRYVVDEAEAELVREVFARRLNREPVNAIAADMARRGVKTSHGKPCSPQMLTKVLRNERYTGVYIWGDVRVEGGMPQIVDRATWEAVQGVKGKKRRAEEEFHDYPLSGRVMCGKCGMNMSGASCYNKKHQRYDYYRCRCGASVNKGVLEGAVVDALRDVLAGDDAYEVARCVESAWRGSGATAVLDAARKRLKAAKDGQARIVRSVEDGMPYSAVRERMEQLMEEQAAAERDIVLHQHDAEFSLDDFVDFLRFGATLDDETLLAAFVWQVIPMEDRYVVTLNYNTKKNTPARLDVPAEVFVQSLDGGPKVLLREHILAVRGGTVNIIIRKAA